MLRDKAISMAIECSAVLVVLPAGVFITTMPARVAAGRSMLSTPTPARTMTFSRSCPSSNSGVSFVALRMMIPSASLSASRTSAGDNPDRIHSEAAFAKLCGVAPQPASSGRTTGRHRLSRSGDRAANSALYIITIVRMRHHQPTRDYVERRTAEGLTKREIIRCLKRYIAREIYKNLPGRASPANASQQLRTAA